MATDVLWNTKGDLAAATGPDAATNLPVGTNGQVLVADSTQPTGLKWGPAPSGGASITYRGQYSASTTYNDGDYVVGLDGVTYQCVVNNTFGVTPTPWAPAPSIPYGTSLPTAPVDGQEAVLVDSVTNPTYQWRFRYNAG